MHESVSRVAMPEKRRLCVGEILKTRFAASTEDSRDSAAVGFLWLLALQLRNYLRAWSGVSPDLEPQLDRQLSEVVELLQGIINRVYGKACNGLSVETFEKALESTYGGLPRALPCGLLTAPLKEPLEWSTTQ
jgi:hypothetical protein